MTPIRLQRKHPNRNLWSPRNCRKWSKRSIQRFYAASGTVRRQGFLGRALAQVAGVYILAENASGLVIVDMHAAAERVLYERMKRAMAESKLAVQELLMPLVVRVTPAQYAAFEEF